MKIYYDNEVDALYLKLGDEIPRNFHRSNDFVGGVGMIDLMIR